MLPPPLPPTILPSNYLEGQGFCHMRKIIQFDEILHGQDSLTFVFISYIKLNKTSSFILFVKRQIRG